MLGFLPMLIYAILAAGNPIKRARRELSDTKGLTQKDFLVTSLPGMTENIPEAEVPLMFAGQLPLYPENNTHYFFWKFVDRQKEPRAENKTIFWLNGGPGCSSMDGALMEAGPFRVNDDSEVTANNGSWHRKGDIVFVDQPAGTGFSYSSEFDSELPQVSWHFLTFLDRYFSLFPEDLTNDILLAGESYAGQYIPYIAQAIVDRNARIAADKHSTATKYNLKGLLIGNGYISPNQQGLSFIPFALENGLITKENPHFSDLLRAHESCQNAVAATGPRKSPESFAVVDRTCDRVLTLLLQYTVDSKANAHGQCINMYDYTLKDSYPSCGMNWPPDLSNVTPFLAEEEVMGDLNLVFHKHWTECSGPVGSHFKAKKSLPSIQLFPTLLQHMEIVLFHGNRDVICNYLGAEMMIKELTWGGTKGFSNESITYNWRHNGSVEGYLRSERNLTYINVFNASHMVPFDKPEVSRALVDILYRDYDVESENADDHSILTYPIGYVPAPAPAPAAAEDKALDTPTNSTTMLDDVATGEDVLIAPSNSTIVSGEQASGEQANNDTKEPPTSNIVRVIQLAVIVVLIWGICALYSTYRSRPTSIIKTKSTGRKKNVSWADELEQAVKEPGFDKAPSFIAKAFNKLKKPETHGNYTRVQHEDIEMNEGVPAGDDFIITSDDEPEDDPARESERESERK
ncbi:hypothetical protein JCM33374_g433 [Metschnikowia sp. JCM 33374]|nr:hypothetical protein JCM33374_g433 [Metschnikowia sp. JCM 33374]